MRDIRYIPRIARNVKKSAAQDNPMHTIFHSPSDLLCPEAFRTFHDGWNEDDESHPCQLLSLALDRTVTEMISKGLASVMAGVSEIRNRVRIIRALIFWNSTRCQLSREVLHISNAIIPKVHINYERKPPHSIMCS